MRVERARPRPQALPPLLVLLLLLLLAPPCSPQSLPRSLAPLASAAPADFVAFSANLSQWRNATLGALPEGSAALADATFSRAAQAWALAPGLLELLTLPAQLREARIALCQGAAPVALGVLAVLQEIEHGGG